MSIKKSDIEIYLILGGIGIAAYYLLPPIIKLLQIPSDILNAPSAALDILKNNQKASASDTANIEAAKLANQKTSIPNVSTDQLSQWVDEIALGKYDSTPIRSNAKSNASVVKYINTDQSAGYVYSAANESLAGKNITWIWLSDTIGGDPFGWIRLDDIKIPSAGIGCTSCNNQGINAFNKVDPIFN